MSNHIVEEWLERQQELIKICLEARPELKTLRPDLMDDLIDFVLSVKDLEDDVEHTLGDLIIKFFVDRSHFLISNKDLIQMEKEYVK